METPAGRPSRAPWALAAVVIVAIVVGAALYVFHSARSLPSDVIEGSRQALREVAAAFRIGTVTTSFRSYATEVQATSRLQFAELRQLEVFERRDEAVVLWGAFRLPDVVIEARAPVAYTYFVDLDKPWSFRLEGQDVFVQAPVIQWNRPAVDVSALRYVVTAGSVFRDEALVQERLRDELTALALLRASQHVPLVREAGRRKVEDFVEGWLVQRFSDGNGYRAHVRFAGEPPSAPPSAPKLPSPMG
jgi:uncharacterized protein with FMN-binding domain